MIYQQKFDLNDESANYFSDEIDVIIAGLKDDADNIRNNYVLSKFSNFRGKIYYFKTNDTAESFSYIIKDTQGEIIDSKENLNLIPDLRRLLISENISNNKVCVDITCLQQAIIFLLTKLLITEIKPRHLFAAYTEPMKYKSKDICNLDEEEFELYEKIVGCNYSVPGFTKISRNEKEILVAPFGFERQRLISVFENVEPKGGLIPVLGFPSFVPGWNLTALFLNYKVLNDAESEQKIKYCEASSPFALYELLKDVYNTYSEEYKILIAPLGTRPHCLGAAIFASKFLQCHLIYDFPVERSYRSENVLKANIYYLSNFIE